MIPHIGRYWVYIARLCIIHTCNACRVTFVYFARSLKPPRKTYFSFLISYHYRSPFFLSSEAENDVLQRSLCAALAHGCCLYIFALKQFLNILGHYFLQFNAFGVLKESKIIIYTWFYRIIAWISHWQAWVLFFLYFSNFRILNWSLIASEDALVPVTVLLWHLFSFPILYI